MCCKYKEGDKVKIEHPRTPYVKKGTKATVIKIEKLGSAYGYDDSDRFDVCIKKENGSTGWYYPSDLCKLD